MIYGSTFVDDLTVTGDANVQGAVTLVNEATDLTAVVGGHGRGRSLNVLDLHIFKAWSCGLIAPFSRSWQEPKRLHVGCKAWCNNSFAPCVGLGKLVCFCLHIE